ncbi:MAG: hypothetical protein C0404_09905 [Verrucomicrobia bacterium]|nr:hypothetical protein [Verrucomicrobiota bacterium]
MTATTAIFFRKMNPMTQRRSPMTTISCWTKGMRNQKTVPMTKKLDRLRARIDALDVKIVDLLNRRASFCVDIGREKRKADAPIHDPSRESKVLRRLARISKGPLGGRAIKAVYRQLISECLELQKCRKEQP